MFAEKNKKNDKTEPLQKKKVNQTGMPDNLKVGMESLSGIDLSNVRVHRNSPFPGQINAHAYAQGNNIHLGPGQERHLPHEAWHVVQQQQGRVKPTAQLKKKDINDDSALEQEADIMGAKALSAGASPIKDTRELTSASQQGAGIIQGYWEKPEDFPGLRISTNHKFAVRGTKELFATEEQIDESNTALERIGALVRLVQGPLKADVEGHKLFAVIPTLSSEDLDEHSKRWKHAQDTQVDPDQRKRFKTFADCFRNSGVVAGIDPDKEETLVLHLPDGEIPIMSREDASSHGIPRHPASRASTTFLQHAIPLFVTHLETLGEDYAELYNNLKARLDNVASSPRTAPALAYKAILRDEQGKAEFCRLFGINSDIAPQIGLAIVQAGDDYEYTQRKEAGHDVWNFHWAGVIMVDDTDYVTLENTALEADEVSREELELNTNQNALIDFVNERWYFALYGEDEQSFHGENMQSPLSTPSGITLPIKNKEQQD